MVDESPKNCLQVYCQALISDGSGLSAIKHVSTEYFDVEQFIARLLASADSRIRKIRAVKNYVNRHHHPAKKIHFIVNPSKRTVFQKCHDPHCQHFQLIRIYHQQANYHIFSNTRKSCRQTF